MQGIKVAKPEGWEDKSMIAYNAPDMPASGVIPNLVVTQDKFLDADGDEASDRIKVFAERQISEMKAKLPQVEIKSQILMKVDKKPAAEICVSWQNGAVRLTQLVTFIARDEKIVVVSTGTAAESDFPDQSANFRTLVKSIQLAA